jgi:hypothetical protein
MQNGRAIPMVVTIMKPCNTKQPNQTLQKFREVTHEHNNSERTAARRAIAAKLQPILQPLSRSNPAKAGAKERRDQNSQI